MPHLLFGNAVGSALMIYHKKRVITHRDVSKLSKDISTNINNSEQLFDNKIRDDFSTHIGKNIVSNIRKFSAYMNKIFVSQQDQLNDALMNLNTLQKIIRTCTSCK